jgi:hypothetical protein
MASAHGSHGAYQGAGHEQQRVLRAKGIRVAIDALKQVAAGKTSPTNKVLHISLVQGHGRDLAAAQIDDQQSSHEAVHVVLLVVVCL